MVSPPNKQPFGFINQGLTLLGNALRVSFMGAKVIFTENWDTVIINVKLEGSPISNNSHAGFQVPSESEKVFVFDQK